MTAIDWASKPEPWRSIGCDFAEEVAAIVGDRSVLAEQVDRFFRRKVKNPDRQRLAEARHAAGMSREALARASGISPTSVGDIEFGTYNATPERRARIAAALGVEVSDIWLDA